MKYLVIPKCFHAMSLSQLILDSGRRARIDMFRLLPFHYFHRTCRSKTWSRGKTFFVSLLCLSHIQPRAPYDFYHPYDFLPVRPSEAPEGFLRRCCSSGHIRLRAPYALTRLYTYGLVEWFARLHECPVRCPYGHRTGPTRESSMFFISYRTRTGSVRDT